MSAPGIDEVVEDASNRHPGKGRCEVLWTLDSLGRVKNDNLRANEMELMVSSGPGWSF